MAGTNTAPPTQPLAPVVFTVNAANYVIATGYLDTGGTGGSGGGGGGSACATPAGKISYVAGTAKDEGHSHKRISYKANIVGTIKISALKITSSDGTNWESFNANGRTYDCVGAPTISPCPVADNGVATLTPEFSLNSGTGETQTVTFSDNVRTTTSMTVVITHDFGCDTLTMNDVR
jgi:hypothetical protein